MEDLWNLWTSSSTSEAASHLPKKTSTRDKQRLGRQSIDYRSYGSQAYQINVIKFDNSLFVYLFVFKLGTTHQIEGARLSWLDVDTVIQFQKLDSAVCISHSANTTGKGINYFPSS